MSKESLRKQQKFNPEWLKDPFTYYVEKSILKDEEGKEVLDEQGNQKFNEYSFYCRLCESNYLCEKFNRHRNTSLTHIKKTPSDKRTPEQIKFLKDHLDAAEKKKIK